MEGPFGYGKGWALRTGLSEPHSTKTLLGLKKGKHFLSHVAKGGHVTLFWSHDIRGVSQAEKTNVTISLIHGI